MPGMPSRGSAPPLSATVLNFLAIVTTSAQRRFTVEKPEQLRSRPPPDQARRGLIGGDFARPELCSGLLDGEFRRMRGENRRGDVSYYFSIYRSVDYTRVSVGVRVEEA